MREELEDFIRRMPKVEIHVHLEGSIQPETLLLLAERNGVRLPVDTVEGLREWYTFTDFDHFVEIYVTIASCICAPEDIEFIAREFLRGQARQRILYSEVTFTPTLHYNLNRRIPVEEQAAALGRARRWAAEELGVGVGWVFDISRNVRPIEQGADVARWAIAAIDEGVVGFGLGGPEVGHPPELFAEAFAIAREAGLGSVPHAGETAGPESIRGAIDALKAQRIGHGVRCLDDPELVEALRERQLPLEVCPSSNVCLGVAPSLEKHPLPRLLDAGLYVTINSDDPPMFNTSLTDEYLRICNAFGFSREAIMQLVLNGVRATLLPEGERREMERLFEAGFDESPHGT
ncbi:MAG: adenosine deaminase [Acidobacteria bacterium]|nr:adenosine deaminase [Acidobacteriota bacterium]MCW5968894.1 adenosine deaminase [Blastocatellales bacterium]